MSEVATIFALSSAPGRSGVAILRVSGPAAGLVLNVMARPRPKPRYAAGRRIVHPTTGEALDRGIVIWFPAPASFTGEDVAELQVHGGRAVVKAMLDALAAIPGCRMAEPGEFARRAFANGKLDLAEIEGLADLIDAETEAQRRQALRQAGGALSGIYESWRKALLEARALIEASLDFADEQDVSTTAMADARSAVDAVARAMRHHLDDGHRGEILRHGFTIVLAGPPNVGKSSLLNALARRDVAIVSTEAGTTRDAIEVHLDLAGLPVIVTDTAGLRDTEAAVEREGIRRTLARVQDADLVLWVMDAHNPGVTLPPELRDVADKVLPVLNKADLLADGGPAVLPDDLIAVSALTGTGLEGLIARLGAVAVERMAPGDDPAITQARHRRHVSEALAALERFLSGSTEQEALRAEDLRQAAEALGRIAGRIDVEDVLDQIFGRFCIGK
ncbi:MAG: tRNA uridine-5-carboxymethylaminomethyl(34) synthesis GTPase MnmE [Pseudomonadota bacterium]